MKLNIFTLVINHKLNFKLSYTQNRKKKLKSSKDSHSTEVGQVEDMSSTCAISYFCFILIT